MHETGSGLPARQQADLQKDIPAIQSIDELSSFVNRLRNALQGFAQKKSAARHPEKKSEGVELCDGTPGGTTPGTETGSPVDTADAGRAQPADQFSRTPLPQNDRELFDGMQTVDSAAETAPAPGRHAAGSSAPSLFKTVTEILNRYRETRKQKYTPTDPELSQDELSRMLDELLQLNILSPSCSDTFLVNRQSTAYLLAKQAYLGMLKLFAQKHPLRKGTHVSGRRGLQQVQPDKTRRTRHLSSRIAVYQTLRRGLRRRALSPYAYLLDEDDLMEFVSRKKVGYTVALALDISGAVQFGKRIQAVRRACMALCYYSRRFHPYDRLHCIAYHETAREISFSEVPRLRAVNGAGKDIGGCLQICRDILRRDPDRVPIIILIGDGLPAHGDRAGFYRFMENNRDYIDKASESARLLRNEGCLFTFLQFREDRHLWREYADSTAQQITAEAGGILCRIDTPADMAVSLVASFEKLTGRNPLFRTAER